MDPSIIALRRAAWEKQKSQQNECGKQKELTSQPTSGQKRPCPTQASAACPTQGSVAGNAASMLRSIPPEWMDAPISSLLADGDALPPPQRQRNADPGEMRVPPEKTAAIRKLLAEPAPTDQMQVLSWNIDGLDEVGGPQALMLRTLEVAMEIARHKPIAVFLQEAIPPSLELLSANPVLGSIYTPVVPENPPLPYYVAILLDKRRVRQLGRPQTIPFPTSGMGRQLLTVRVEVSPPFPGSGDLGPIIFATAHLESTKDHAPERKRQLSRSFQVLNKAFSIGGQSASTVIFGGDLNIRDEEVKAVNRESSFDSSRFADVWEYCGSPPAQRWTWDTSENSNLGVKYTSKTRFDRLYFHSPGISDVASASASASNKGPAPRSSAKDKTTTKGPTTAGIYKQAANDRSGWRPVSISLLGKKKVPNLGRYPSDHWGVLTTWHPGGTSNALGKPQKNSSGSGSNPLGGKILTSSPAAAASAPTTNKVPAPVQAVEQKAAVRPEEFVGGSFSRLIKQDANVIDLDDA